MVAALPIKQEIGARVAERQSTSGVGQGLHLDIEKSRGVALVTPDGMIILSNPDDAVLLYLQPQIVDRKVVWTCHGTPARDVPAECR